MAYCKANQLDCNDFCNRFDAPCIKENCRFFGVKTNADRIRAMSDEELANFLTIFANDEGEDFFCDNPKRRVACRECKRCIMEWLKQPAEEDTE